MPIARKPTTLKALRESLGRTQEETARRAGVPQGEISKTETRTSHRVSSVRRYVEALGGRLEITALIRGKRIRLKDL